ncbi:MAG: transposase [Candidatus Methylomirabilales bacterium]
MARKPRVQFPGAFYHVLIRGNRREAIFFDDTDRHGYLGRLHEARQRFAFTLYAYVLMPNHVHLLLETGDVVLSRIMQWLGTTYTQYFNRRHHKIGHLFQGRYKAILCDKDAYLLALVRYLHLNPVRAGLVKNPAKYRWSSHCAYLGVAHDVSIPRDIVLAQFSHKLPRAVAAYEGYITQGMREGQQARYYQVVDQCYLGDEEFVSRVKMQAGEPTLQRRKKVGASLEEVVRRVSRSFHVDITALKQPVKTRQVVEVRDILSYIVREYTLVQGAELARMLCVDPTVISRGATRIAQRAEKGGDLAATIEELVGRLSHK